MTEGEAAPLAAMDGRGHEHVGYFRDEPTGLRCPVAVSDTRLGPAVGGTRTMAYETEAGALEDALRLSEAIAYKTAAADFDVGGGKAVTVGAPTRRRTISSGRTVASSTPTGGRSSPVRTSTSTSPTSGPSARSRTTSAGTRVGGNARDRPGGPPRQ